MGNPKVIGATGAPAIPLDKQAEVIACVERYHEVVSKSKMYSRQESLHAPAIVRKAARDARLMTTYTSTKLEINTSTEINASSVAKLSISDMPTQVDKLVKEIEKVCLNRSDPPSSRTLISRLHVDVELYECNTCQGSVSVARPRMSFGLM